MVSHRLPLPFPRAVYFKCSSVSSLPPPAVPPSVSPQSHSCCHRHLPPAPRWKNWGRQLLNYFINFNLIQLITFSQTLPALRSSRLEVPSDAKCHCGRPCMSSGARDGKKKNPPCRSTPAESIIFLPWQNKDPLFLVIL